MDLRAFGLARYVALRAFLPSGPQEMPMMDAMRIGFWLVAGGEFSMSFELVLGQHARPASVPMELGS